MEDKAEHVLNDSPPDWIAAIARDEGPELGGSYRVVVIEGDGRHDVSDFLALEEALQYADDAASESEVPCPIAYVFAPGDRYVRRGRHYAEKQSKLDPDARWAPQNWPSNALETRCATSSSGGRCDATPKRNKAVVLRFNREVIERGDLAAFGEIMAKDFVNRTAPSGMSSGPDGMLSTFNNVLRLAFPDLRVEVHDQIAEGDKVTTRKTIHGTHQGPLLGIAPTGKRVAIEVIDIVRLRDGQYVEHWGINTLSVVLAQLRSSIGD